MPAVLALDWEAGWLGVEWIDGGTVKQAIRDRDSGDEEALKSLLTRIGEVVGRLHKVGVVHGDLTSSNMMLRPPQSGDRRKNGSLEGKILLIDFGLAMQSVQEEERAVDLYVLERAFGSTHPREEGLFGVVLEAYGGSYKGAKAALRRLEDVRLRGRKKSMIG